MLLSWGKRVIPGGLRVAALALFLTLVWLIFSPGSISYGKDFVLRGTVDCGAVSGSYCPIGSTLTLWTTDVDGSMRRVELDISWIRQQFGDVDQDDYLAIEVRDLGDGRFQAIGLVPANGTNRSYRQEDDRDVKSEVTATPVLTNTPSATSTATGTATATSTVTRTASPTSTPTATITATPTSTATVTVTPSPSHTATATQTPTFTNTPTATPTFTPVPPRASIGNASAQPDCNDPVIMTFTVTLDVTVNAIVTINYHTVDGTAVSPVHYIGVPAGVLTIPANTANGTINITIPADPGGTRGGEQFTVVLDSAVNATINPAANIGTGTIIPTGGC